FRRFCDVAGLGPLTADPRYATNPARVVHYDALYGEMAPALRSRPRAQWIEQLTQAGVPCGAVRAVPDVLTDPQIQARRTIGSLTGTATPQGRHRCVASTRATTTGTRVGRRARVRDISERR